MERGEWREERGVLRSEDRGWMSENCLAAISIILNGIFMVDIFIPTPPIFIPVSASED